MKPTESEILKSRIFICEQVVEQLETVSATAHLGSTVYYNDFIATMKTEIETLNLRVQGFQLMALWAEKITPVNGLVAHEIDYSEAVKGFDVRLTPIGQYPVDRRFIAGTFEKAIAEINNPKSAFLTLQIPPRLGQD